MSHRRPRRSSLLASALTVCALALAACGSEDEAASTAVEAAASGATSAVADAGSTAAATDAGTAGATEVQLIKEGTLTTCTHLPYAPFQFEQDGKIVGFDVDLVDLIAKELGVQQAIVDTPFEGIKSGQDLSTGKCDIAAAGMTITDERKQVIDFTDPYFDATQALLVPEDSDVTSLEDLDGQNLGVQSGTTGKDYVDENKPAGVEVTEFEDLATEQQALATGQIAGAVNDLPVWLDYIKKNPGKFKIATEFDTGEQYGFGIRKDGNPELLRTANEVLSRAKSDGTYDEIYKKWFGTEPSAS